MVFQNYLLTVNLIHWIVKQVQEGKLDYLFHVYFNKYIFFCSPDKRTMSLDYTSMDDEHKLIARYAARLAAEAKVVSQYYLKCFINSYTLICSSLYINL